MSSDHISWPCGCKCTTANGCKPAGTSMHARCSIEQERARRHTGHADQSSLLGSRQSLDRGLQLAGHRLIRAEELSKQPTRWIRPRVSRTRPRKVLCVTRRHVKRDPGVDRVAAAQNQVHMPALGRPLSGRSRTGRWGRHGPILVSFTQDRHPRFPNKWLLPGSGLNGHAWPGRSHHCRRLGGDATAPSSPAPAQDRANLQLTSCCRKAPRCFRGSSLDALHCGHSGRRLISGYGCPGVPPTDPGACAASSQRMASRSRPLYARERVRRHQAVPRS